MYKCTPRELEFLRQVSAASVCNPFGEARRQLDLELARATSAWSRSRVIEGVRGRVRAGVSELMCGGRRISDFPEDQRGMVRDAVGFMIFHEFGDAFDSLIERQIAEPSAGVEVPRADELVAEFRRFGFAQRDIPLYVAWFFQMRRAFYFIDQGLLGVSPCMQALREALWNNVFTHALDRYERWLWNRMEDFSTLLLGPTGTGKGNAAAAIGRSAFIPYNLKSKRFAASFAEAFVSVNLSQYPESLIESELFGHRKGAFTGAVENHAGALAACSPHGAIFLDEIGEVALPVQVKLLQVLQERRYSPVGSHESQAFRGRVIAATHQPLDRLRREGQFRDDFYYRLCSDRIQVPSLQQRISEDPEELAILVRFVVGRLLGESVESEVDEVHGRIVDQLGLEYAWPGNVRELEQCVRRILICGSYGGTHMQADPAESEGAGLGRWSPAEEGEWSAKQLLEHYCRHLYGRLGSYEEVARSLELDRRTVKKYIIGEAKSAK